MLSDMSENKMDKHILLGLRVRVTVITIISIINIISSMDIITISLYLCISLLFM